MKRVLKFFIFILTFALVAFVSVSNYGLKAQTTNRFKVSYVNVRDSVFGLIADLSVIDYEYNEGLGSDMSSWFEYAVNSGRVSDQWFQVDLPYVSKVFILAEDTDILYSSYEVKSLTAGISGFIEGVGLMPDDSSIFPDGFAYIDPIINNKLTVLLSDTVYKDIYDLGYKNGVDETLADFDDIFKGEYERGKQDGIDIGVNQNPNNNFGAMISTVLSGVGSILSVELLPGISIGAIIAVPIIFGIISFVLGRRKD